MRGKTNIGGGGGISINAEVQNKVIQSGQIISGDFVEYYSTPKWIDLAGSIDFKFNIGDYAIALSGGFITAFRDGARVATYTEYGASAINKVGNWIAFFSIGTSTVGLLSIENDEFNLIDSIEIAGLGTISSYKSDIAAGGGKLIVRCYYDMAVIDMAIDGSLSNAVITSNVFSTNSIGFLNYGIDGFYEIFISESSYTFQPSSVFIIPLTIDSSNHITAGSSRSINTKIYLYRTTTEYNGIPRQIYQNGNIVAITGTYYQYDSRYSEEDYHGQQGYINFINMATGDASIVIIPDHGEALSCISDGKLITSKCYQKSIGSGQLEYMYQANGIKFYDFDGETFTLTEIAAKEYEEDTENAVVGNRAGCANNYVYAQLRQTGSEHPGGIRVYYATEDNLIDVPNSDYVVPYVDGGHSIGVAKDSGIAGSTIGVYIPISS